jgi:hypothetical protein
MNKNDRIKELKKISQQMSFWNRVPGAFVTKIEEKLFKDFALKMEELRDIDSVLRGIALGENRTGKSVKDLVGGVDYYYKNNRFVDAMFLMYQFNDVLVEIITAGDKEIPSLKDIKQFYDKDFEVPEKLNYLPETDLSVFPKEAQLAQNLYKKFFGSPLEKAFASEVAKRKAGVGRAVSATANMLSSLLGMFDRMGLYVAGGKIDKWLDEFKKIKAIQSRYKNVLDTVYIQSVKDLVAKAREIGKSEELGTKESLNKVEKAVGEVSQQTITELPKESVKKNVVKNKKLTKEEIVELNPSDQATLGKTTSTTLANDLKPGDKLNDKDGVPVAEVSNEGLSVKLEIGEKLIPWEKVNDYYKYINDISSNLTKPYIGELSIVKKEEPVSGVVEGEGKSKYKDFFDNFSKINKSKQNQVISVLREILTEGEEVTDGDVIVIEDEIIAEPKGGVLLFPEIKIENGELEVPLNKIEDIVEKTKMLPSAPQEVQIINKEDIDDKIDETSNIILSKDLVNKIKNSKPYESIGAVPFIEADELLIVFAGDQRMFTGEDQLVEAEDYLAELFGKPVTLVTDDNMLSEAEDFESNDIKFFMPTILIEKEDLKFKDKKDIEIEEEVFIPSQKLKYEEVPKVPTPWDEEDISDEDFEKLMEEAGISPKSAKDKNIILKTIKEVFKG